MNSGQRRFNNNNPRGKGRRRRGRGGTRRGRYNTMPRSNRGNTSSGYRAIMPFRNQLAMPDSIIVDLSFTDTGVTFTPAGAMFGAFRYRGNSAFDPDPNLGGETALYFPQWAAFYRRYRVLTVKVACTIVNNENFPVILTYAPTDLDFASSINSTPRALDLGEMPYGEKPMMMSAKGGMDRVSFTRIVNWGRFVGNEPAYRVDDLYAALNNTNPVNTTDLTFAVCAGSNFVNGVGRDIRLTYRVLWTDRNFDFASLRKQPIPNIEEERHDIPESTEEQSPSQVQITELISMLRKM